MVTNKMVIRRAVKADAPRMMELIKELAVFERAPDEVTVSMEHFVESGFGEKPVWWAFVVCSADETGDGNYKEGPILGFALYYIRYSTWKGQRMYLEDIIVTEKARRKGVGKMLMDQLIEEAKTKGFSGIMWQVLEWNESAINFYKKYNAKFDPEWVNCTIELKK